LVDITERKRAEAMLRQQIEFEETIRVQNAVLAELSTPLIPISDHVMVMPLIGAVDSRRAQQVLETLLQGIASSGTQVAILDITGVPVVDTQVANALIHAAQAVKLLGAQVVLTGIRPEVAQTLVGLGADLGGIITRSSLQSGIAYAATWN
jgi:rsbT co-antagonist protein RsbR